jgi:hypothetical protein
MFKTDEVAANAVADKAKISCEIRTASGRPNRGVGSGCIGRALSVSRDGVTVTVYFVRKQMTLKRRN